MSSDCILLIHSDSHGNPTPSGGNFHFVRRSDNPAMHVVNQMTAGGQYPGDDCGPADLLSRLYDDGRSASMHALEKACNTQGYGTSTADLLLGLWGYGYAADRVLGDPPRGWIHNPAWGGLIGPSGFDGYMAASAHEYIVIHTPGAWETAPVSNPTPVGGRPESQEENPDVISVLRPDGITRDIFTVDAAGTGRHTVVVDNGNPGVPYNDVIPGSWSEFLRAYWAPDMSSLTVIGRASVGGQTYFDYWKPPGTWSGPVKQP